MTCEICGRSTAGGRLCSLACVEENARLEALGNDNARFRCRVCKRALTGRAAWRIPEELRKQGFCADRCKTEELLKGAQGVSRPETLEQWRAELDRRLLREPQVGFGEHVMAVLREIAARPPRVSREPEVLFEGEKPLDRRYMMNPEAAESEDSTTRRFALLEIDEEK